MNIKLNRYKHRIAACKLPVILRYSNLDINRKINIKNEYTEGMHLAKSDSVGAHGQPRRAMQSPFWMEFKKSLEKGFEIIYNNNRPLIN
jgi:hypothetical protein